MATHSRILARKIPWTGFPGGSVVNNLFTTVVWSVVWSLDWEDPLEKGNDILLQYSCLYYPTDRGAWQAIVHGVAKSWTWLNTHCKWRCGEGGGSFRFVFRNSSGCSMKIWLETESDAGWLETLKWSKWEGMSLGMKVVATETKGSS